MSRIPAYRLVKRRFADRPFDGEGPRRYGGRWNSPGKRCIYVAESESLAMLEVLAHLKAPNLLGFYRLFRVNLPENQIQNLRPEALPGDWRDDPAPHSTAIIGDEWLDRGDHLALAVPSTLAIRDRNFLVNPGHENFADFVQSAEELSLRIDRRLLAR